MRGKLLGPKGSYLKHIQDQTGIRIQLAGKGSGNMTNNGQAEHLEERALYRACGHRPTRPFGGPTGAGRSYVPQSAA